jgi:hypothetical protein
LDSGRKTGPRRPWRGENGAFRANETPVLPRMNVPDAASARFASVCGVGSLGR